MTAISAVSVSIVSKMTTALLTDPAIARPTNAPILATKPTATTASAKFVIDRQFANAPQDSDRLMTTGALISTNAPPIRATHQLRVAIPQAITCAHVPPVWSVNHSKADVVNPVNV